MLEIFAGKQSLRLAKPIMNAAGVMGFGGEYNKLIPPDTFGAFVTNPLTWRGLRAAEGMRVAALDSGMLIHTGLPNLGLQRAVQRYGARWANSPIPVIVHVAANTADELTACAGYLDGIDKVAALEVGLADHATHREARLMIGAARSRTQLPILARLPLYQAGQIAAAAVEAGADALVVAAPPRGSARDPISGRLIGGRVYGTWLKALALRVVGWVARNVHVPIIGSGGIHTPDDAREFLEAGARAIQLDSVIWIRPSMAALIAEDLTVGMMTRAANSLADDMYTGYIDPAARRAQLLPSPPPLPPPPTLPED